MIELTDFEERICSKLDGLQKADAYRNDPQTQRMLFQVNLNLQTLEMDIVQEIPDHHHIPILLIGFVPRSGSTLLTQLLAQSGLFNYISNFQARFWFAPYIGGILEKSLDMRLAYPTRLESDYGRTAFPSAPNEFRYFWEYWLPFSNDKPHTFPRRKWVEIDVEKLAQEINALRSLAVLPLFFKKEWLGMNAGFFIENITNTKTILMLRDPLYVAESIYKAKQDVYGSFESWWGDKPSNYDRIKTLDTYHQIAGQIRGIRDDIEYWGKQYPNYFMTLYYEDLVDDVHRWMARIFEFVEIDGASFDWSNVPEKLENKNRHKLDAGEVNMLKEALQEFGL